MSSLAVSSSNLNGKAIYSPPRANASPSPYPDMHFTTTDQFINNKQQSTTSKASNDSAPSPVSIELKNGTKIDLLQTPNRHQSAIDFILPLSHELNGSTSLLKGLLMDGSEETRQQVADLQEKDICIGISSTYNKLLLSARCPKGKEETMIKGLIKLLQQPNWSNEDFKRLSEESKSAIQEQVHNPDFPLKLSLLEALYGLHQPYSLTPQDCVEKINAQSLDKVLHQLQSSITEQPLHILMASPISLTEQNTLIKKQMEAWQLKPNPFKPSENILSIGQDTDKPGKVGLLLIPNDTIKRARINIVSQAIKPGESDYPAFLVLNMILGGHAEGSFFNKLRTQDGLVYGVSTERSSLPVGTGRWYEVSMECDFNKIPPAIHDLLAVTQNAINKPPSPELLQTSKEQFLLALSERTQTAWGSVLNEEPWLIENLPPASEQDLQNAVKQVSAEDVHRVAQKIFASPQRTQLIGVSAPTTTLKQSFPSLPLTQPVL